MSLQDSSVWPEANRFDPGRFQDDRKNSLPPLAFSPFGFAGKRICPGMRFTYVEASILLAALVRAFHFDEPRPAEPKPRYGLVTYPEKVTLRVRRRV